MLSRLFLAPFLLLAVFFFCVQPLKAQVEGLYDNKAAGVSFVAPPGWKVAETTSRECLFAVEAVKDRDCRFQICISPPRADMLLTRNAFVSCENLKSYITSQLKGVNPVCQRGRAGNLYAFDTVYERRIQTPDGIRVQLVNHLFAPAKGRLVQVMAYTLGDTEAEARRRYLENRRALDRLVSGVRFKSQPFP
ncbi:hypothetical protein JCM15519_11250 [Fundidesulfovibrio butyratiphilus]